MPDGVVNESSRPTRKPIEVYRDTLPFLTAQTLAPLSTFSPDLRLEQTQEFFEAALARSILYPLQLLDGMSPESDFKRYPGYQNELKRLVGIKPAQALSIAQEMVDSPVQHFSETTGIHLIFGAFQEMHKAFPNISFFRAAELTESMQEEGVYTHSGIDFAPAGLSIAMRYYDDPFGGGTRRYPIMAVAPFSSVVSAYQNGQVFLRTEGSWWRSSLELNLHYKRPPRLASYWRLPDQPEQRSELLNCARETGIKQEHLALLN